MAKEKISVSQEGVGASLLTFISDHSTSLIIVAYFLAAYNFSIFNKPLKDTIQVQMLAEDKWILGILILLLLHPIGLLINTASWLSFGWMEKWFEIIHFKHATFLTRGTNNSLCVNRLKTKFKLTFENFYEKARLKEHFLMVNYPDTLNGIEYVLAASTLLRNLTFCSIILVIIHLCSGQPLVAAYAFASSIGFTIINSTASFYYSLHILMIFYSLRKNKEIAL